MRRFTLKLLAFLMITGFMNALVAQEAATKADHPATAHATVELVSEQLIGMLGDAKERFEQDPEGFYSDVEGVISPWMDFGRWARSVMGRDYAAQATEEQLQAFESVFRKSLIETYAKGLINVEDTGYEIEPAQPGDENKNGLWVKQTLYSGADKIGVEYAMLKAEEGRWQVADVRLEGIRLRQTFQSQFKSAALDNEGDLDKVIEGWGA